MNSKQTSTQNSIVDKNATIRVAFFGIIDPDVEFPFRHRLQP